MRDHVGILILLLLSTVSPSIVVTECNQQLHNYYVALGMPMVTPVLAAVNITSGTFFGTPFVEVQLGFQEVARFYAGLLPNTTLANQSFVSYVTVDVPWCATDIAFQCCDNITLGTAKTSNCTTLVDFDLGGSDPIAGRFFIYSNQTTSCGGTPVITFFNVTLQPLLTDTYTYDVVGLQQHRELSFVEAQNLYRTSPCQFSDGSPSDVVNSSQFVCVEQRIGCNTTRMGGTPTLQVIPLPEFACIGFSMNSTNTQTVLWKVVSLQPPGGIQGTYGITWVNNLALAPGTEAFYALYGTQFILIPDTVRQFDSGIDSLTQYALLFYQGRWVNYQPLYPFSVDPFVAAVPCACGFSMFCDQSFNADITSLYNGVVLLNNALPICNPGPNQFVGFGSPSFTISANASFDPDNAPYPFNTYWRIYSTPYDPSPPPFTITDPAQTTITFPAATLAQGSYIFLLYASDLQTQIPCFLNVTILPNQVFAVVDPDFIIPFTFYSGLDANHSCLIFPPSPSIPLNGSYSYSTNPAAPFYCNWIQTGGFPLTFSCDPSGFTSTAAFFNTTDCIARFVPPLPGLYCFLLTVTDNVTNSSAAICVQVNPNFQQPESTFTPIFNFTPSPIRNLTFPPRPILNFSNYSLPPFNIPPPIAPTPTPNTTGPPLVPTFPAFNFSDYAVLVVLLICVILFFLFAIYMFLLYREESFYRVLDKKTYGGGSTSGRLW
jgi:hypothetical protein